MCQASGAKTYLEDQAYLGFDPRPSTSALSKRKYKSMDIITRKDDAASWATAEGLERDHAGVGVEALIIRAKDEKMMEECEEMTKSVRSA
jgi:hypothetical protein